MHQTVFLTTAIDYLQVRADHWYLDCTFGAGGHTAELINRGGLVFAFEYDRLAYERGLMRFESAIALGKLILVNDNFAHLQHVIEQHQRFGFNFKFAGALFDLGTSSDQLTAGGRGLSVYENGPLDMRLDASLGVTARDLLLVLSEKQLISMFYELGGELESRKIARAIVTQRNKRGQEAFTTSFELANLVSRIKKAPQGKLHPATKVFQALRITVNDELGNLQRALPQAFSLLDSKGRLVVISFHEGEDRPVKYYFKSLADAKQATLVLKKPLVPDSQELQNPRSRSAKMRVIEKI